MRRLALLTAAGAVWAATSVTFATPAQAQGDPASRALAYLAGQQQADGSIPSAFPSYAPTEDTAIAVAAAGGDPSILPRTRGKTLIDFLRAAAVDASTGAGRTGKLIQAVVAAHLSPHDFGGRDLVAILESSAHAAGGEIVYGDGQAFTEALAIQGLRAAGVTVPVAALSHLENAANPDGGWNFVGIPGDPSGSDTNSTAMALMALAAAGDHSRDRAAIGFLHTQQSRDGGFPFQAGPASHGDADSTALVVQALVAVGEDPSGCGWMAGQVTPYRALTAMQDPSGGFPGYGGVDAFTTSQVPAALLLRAFPAVGVDGAADLLGNQQAAAAHALEYLHRQQAPDGSIPSGFPSYAPSENFVIAIAAAGVDPATVRRGPTPAPSVIDYLAAHVVDASASAGRAGELIQAVVAAGLRPDSFAGQNLITTLQTYYHASSGAFGDGQNFSQTLAIQGLIAAGAAVPTAAVSNLLAAEDADGGWNYLDVKDAGAGSDTNATSMALMALDAAGHRERDAVALAFLRARQQADGGFGFQGGPTDPDSTALVAQALVAAQQGPGPVLATGTEKVFTSLIATQDVSGGYAGYGGVDAFTTSQVPAALERLPFPSRAGVPAAWASGAGLDALAAGPVRRYGPAIAAGCTAPPSATGGLGPATSSGPAPGASVQPGVGSDGGIAVDSGSSGGSDLGASGDLGLGTDAAGPAASEPIVPDPLAPAVTDAAGVGSLLPLLPTAGGVQGASATARPLTPPARRGGGLALWAIYLLAALAPALMVAGGGIVVGRAGGPRKLWGRPPG